MFFRTASSALVLFIASFSANGADNPPPSPEQFQAYLHKLVDSGGATSVAPFYPGESTQKLANAILDGLWAEKSYRENMAGWLSTEHADSIEDMLADWGRHYHKAFSGLYEFLPDEDTQLILWRLLRGNAIYTLNREDCQTKAQAQVGEYIQTAHLQFLADNWKKLASTLPKALGREFARENAPHPGDRPIPEFMFREALASLRATEKTWPDVDAKRIEDQYSYGKKNWSPQELCEVTWVVSHAINDSQVRDKQVSAVLMRSTLLQSGYDETFRQSEVPLEPSQWKVPGFTPGKIVMYYPPIIMRNSVRGITKFAVKIDEFGKVIDVSLSSDTLHPSTLTTIDGLEVSSGQVLLTLFNKYFRAGSFAPKVVDGKAEPYTVDVPMNWQFN